MPFNLYGATVGYWSRFELSNMTGNSGMTSACTLWIANSGNVTVQLCDFRLNSGPSCLGFGPVANASIRCLSVPENNCTRSEAFNGLFHSASAVTIADSIIVGNTMNYLTGGDSTVTFLSCHFDTFSYLASGSGG
jgi:hypothetical protein